MSWVQDFADRLISHIEIDLVKEIADTTYTIPSSKPVHLLTVGGYAGPHRVAIVRESKDVSVNISLKGNTGCLRSASTPRPYFEMIPTNKGTFTLSISTSGGTETKLVHFVVT